MKDILFWIYFFNIILLIIHEIDSGYWKEWVLFKLPGGVNVFLLLHLPMLFVFLYGLIQIYIFNYLGMIFSFVIVISGIGCFYIHNYYLKRGYKEFNTLISLSLIYSILFTSIIQLIVTIISIMNFCT